MQPLGAGIPCGVLSLKESDYGPTPVSIVPEPQLILVKVINVTNSNRRWCGTRPTIRVPMWSWLGVLTVAFADGPTRFCGKSENLYIWCRRLQAMQVRRNDLHVRGLAPPPGRPRASVCWSAGSLSSPSSRGTSTWPTCRGAAPCPGLGLHIFGRVCWCV